MKHPMQVLFVDSEGAVRFTPNKIIQDLLEHSRKHGFGLNEIADRAHDPEDMMQLMQLLGYRVGPYNELSFVTDESWDQVEAAVKALKKT